MATVSRFRVFARDNFRRFYCGKSSIEDGKELHLDHVRPVSLGGLRIAGNLVTSCKECNLSKKAGCFTRGLADRIFDEVYRRCYRCGLKPSSPVRHT